MNTSAPALDPRSSGTRPALARLRDALTIAGFAAALVLPALDLAVRPASVRDPARFELRTAAAWPAPPADLAALAEYPQQIEDWYDDALGLRDQLLRVRSAVRMFGFGVAATPEVLPGEHGFLFFTGNHTIEIHRGVRPFDATELDTWCRMLDARRAACEQRGIAYVFAIGPDKESIYADYLPRGCEPLGPTRLEQLVRALPERAPRVEFLDLRPALLAARADDGPRSFLYSRLGTHWDGRGSFVAYRELVAALRRHADTFPAFTWSEVTKLELDENADSWALRMYIQDWMERHSLIVDLPAGRRHARKIRAEDDQGSVGMSQVANQSLPRVLLFHDSFVLGLLPLFAVHCAQLHTTSRVSFDTALLDEIRPHVVVELWVERIFDEWDPAARFPVENSAAAPAETPAETPAEKPAQTPR